jgi:hypothetical protein
VREKVEVDGRIAWLGLWLGLGLELGLEVGLVLGVCYSKLERDRGNT